MSDRSTSWIDDDRDNLGEFLTKLARFGIDQCLHFAHLIATKQRFIENVSTINPKYQDKRIQLNHFAIEIQTLQNEFYQILLILSSSDDSTKQLLFIKLQNYLANFMEMNSRLKSFDLPANEILLNKIEQSDRRLSTISSISTIPQITVSSSFNLNEEIIDLGKNWKFANIIHTRFEISLIASNTQEIVCYNNQNHFLHFILITGQFQGNIKWNHDPIIDILWCSFIDRYIAVTRHSLYTIQYNRSNSINANKVLDIEKFHSARIACNQNNILLYTTQQQSSSIQIYDSQFNLVKIFHSSIKNSPSFCCTNTLMALIEKEEVLISRFPYITPKKVSLLLFDIETFQLRYTVDLNNCSNISTMKCLEQYNIFFALSDEKILWIIQIDHHETVQIAKKPFYTNQTEMCIVNNRDLLLINVNAGHAIQLIKYRKIKQ